MAPTYKTLSTTSQSLVWEGVAQSSRSEPGMGNSPLRMMDTQESVKPASMSRLMLSEAVVQRSLKSPARMVALPWEFSMMNLRSWSMPAERASSSQVVSLKRC
jgi:hypothetical protein